MTIAMGLLSGITLVAIALLVRSRHGWARWVYALMYVFGTVSGGFVLGMALQFFLELPLPGLLNLAIGMVLQTAALVFLFSRTSGQWFKTKNDG